MSHEHSIAFTACLLLALASCGGDSGTAAGSSETSSTTSSSATGATTDPSTGVIDPTTSGSSESTGAESSDGAPGDSSTTEDPGDAVGRVHVVIFTHIEDATPGGTIGSPENRMQYTGIRDRLIDMATLAQSHALQWVLQPDWKILVAALEYEDAELMASTNDKNFLRYLVEDLGVVIDPHSHENGGYNYTDVAYLLESLDVGGSTVIGGHIWDPALPQFQEWDRFRDPVAGMMYPDASWRGDILIGSGTPNHVNDPLVSGIWRPLDRDDYWTDDPNGNIVAVGAWHDDLAGVQELALLYTNGEVEPDRLLTASWNITPTSIMAEGGLAAIEQDVLVPLAGMRDDGSVVVTDFTTLIDRWESDYGGEAFLHQP